MVENGRGLGITETEYDTFAQPPEEMPLESGNKLGPITVAYETYGRLNADKSNAIPVVHALSGDAHAAGWHEGDKSPGWWGRRITVDGSPAHLRGQVRRALSEPDTVRHQHDPYLWHGIS